MKYDAAAFWGSAQVGDIEDCWPWKGSKNVSGYGVFKGSPAHVISLLAGGQTVAKRHCVQHMCGHKDCINPYHLQIMLWSDHSKVTRREATNRKAAQ